MKHVLMFSGAIGSYMTSKRVIDKHGKENTLILFTDTKTEDEDLYRFINESASKLDVKLITLTNGRKI